MVWMVLGSFPGGPGGILTHDLRVKRPQVCNGHGSVAYGVTVTNVVSALDGLLIL